MRITKIVLKQTLKEICSKTGLVLHLKHNSIDNSYDIIETNKNQIFMLCVAQKPTILYKFMIGFLNGLDFKKSN